MREGTGCASGGVPRCYVADDLRSPVSNVLFRAGKHASLSAKNSWEHRGTPRSGMSDQRPVTASYGGPTPDSPPSRE